MSEDRLDRLIAALASTTPVLDDVTRARIAANLDAARAAPPVRLPATHRRWWIGGAAAAAAGVTLALVLAWRGRAPIVAAGATTRPPSAELPEDGLLSAGAQGPVHATVAGAEITLNGPGWVRRQGATILAEATSLVVDRTLPGTAAAPLVVRIAGATIRLQSARFSADSAQVLVVRVERGEIWLRCPDAERERSLVASQAATCRGSTADRRAAVPAEVPPPPPAIVADATAPAPHRPPAATIAAAPVRRASAAMRPRAAAPGAVVDALVATAAAPDPTSAAGATPRRADAHEPAPLTQLARADAGGVRDLAPLPETSAPDRATRYTAAEHLMSIDPVAARAALGALVAEAPQAPEAGPAMLDIAWLAARAGDLAAARTALERLPALPGGPALALPAAYLRCVLEQEPIRLAACLLSYRAAYPSAANDAEVLARVAVALAAAGDCRAARPLLVEYRQRYPHGTSGATLQTWRDACSRGEP